MSVGNNIKNKRLECNMTIEKLSKLTKISPNSLTKYEEDRREPRLAALKNIAKALDCTMEALVSHEPFSYIILHADEFCDAAWTKYCEICDVPEDSKTITIPFRRPDVSSSFDSDTSNDEEEVLYACGICGEIFSDNNSAVVCCPTCGMDDEEWIERIDT